MENMVSDKSPVVSVIMNCYNSEKFLEEAIDSVYAQTFTDWEIIFWDNASTDRSAQIAKSYDGKLKYFRNPQTDSLGRARNLALEQTRGEFIGFLDCDDLWCPQKIQQQIDMFRARPDTGLVFSNVEIFSKGKPSYLFYLRHQPPEGMVFRELVRSYFLSLASVMVRRSAFDRLDKWFDGRFSVVEEADLFMRIAHDHPIAYCPEVLARVRLHPRNYTTLQQDRFAKEQKMLLEKFLALWPDFEEQCREEIAYHRECIECHQGNVDWEKGNGIEARMRFRPYLKTSPRRWVSYLLSYFPYSFYRSLRDGYKTLVQPLRGMHGKI